ncbi:MAG: Hsp20/alpha crystallin family protein, partial [Actinobacteria bacterium]|nr:Hsp20/alpha crystallin family protein [Actinomycetota bacterium]
RNATDKDVSAEYEDGILEVRVPLNGKDADTRHVPIKHK